MIYLTLPELLHVAERTLGGEPPVRDHGFLQSALARPRAAALLHSLARSHALADGNKRLALAATIAFLGVNGRRLTLSNDQEHQLIMGVTAGDLDHVSTIAERTKNATEAR